MMRLSSTRAHTREQRRTRRARVLGGLVAAAIGAGAGVLPTPTAGPVSAAGLQVIPMEAVNANHVVLGDLASRSQRQPVTIAGIGPYTISGTDSITGDPYSFVTDYNYSPTARAAYARESDERALSGGFTATSNANATRLDRSGVLMLKSTTNCLSGNLFDGLETYCSVFGPEVYSEPFDATIGQAVSFDWSALRVTDDYEIYAFLVQVQELSEGVFDYGDAESHTLLTYGRGHNQGWTTASGDVPADGTYRFRFVNGSFDGTGGYALGSEMYIDSVVRVGLSNPITFAPLGDKLVNAAPFTISATAPAGAVTFTSSTPGRCTVDGDEVTLVEAATGICTIVANQAGDGVDYVPAETVARSFTILAAATAPTNSGVPLIQGTVAEGETLTMTEGTWADGGEPITDTDIQWNSTVDGATTAIAGVTGTTCLVMPLAGSTITVTVTKTNSVGSTDTTSAATISGYTCAVPASPTWTDSTIGQLQIDVAFADGVTASAAPAATYAVTAGSLPNGLSLNASTGAIEGTPTEAGPYDFTVTATNGIAPDVTVQLKGTIAPANSAPTITTTALAELRQGKAFSQQITATGYPAPTFTVSQGSLPAGLTLDAATGAITGTPTGSGPYDFTISAANGVGSPATVRLQGTITPAGEPKISVQVATPTGTPLGGSTVSVNATGLAPNSTVTVRLGDIVLGTLTTDATGAAEGELTLPADVEPGKYELTASGAKAGGGDVAATTSVVADLDGRKASGGGVEGYTPLDPLRVLDSRVAGAKVEAGQVYQLKIDDGWGIADDATSVVVNLTVTQPGEGGWIVAYPCGDERPWASTANFNAGDTVANAVTVALNDTGAVCFYSTATTHLVIDLNGFHSPSADDKLVPYLPARLLDTREQTMLRAGETVEIDVIGPDAAAEGSSTVVLNVTSVGGLADGFVTIHPCGQPLPLASNLNFIAGSTVANQVFAKVGDGGKVCAYVESPTHLVVDLNAAFAEGSVAAYGGFVPTRVLDTRETGPKPGAGHTIELTLGTGHMSDAAAFALNVTTAGADESGFVTVYPCESKRPWASNVNFRPGRDVANHVTATADTDGKICLFTSASTHVVIDVVGAYL